MATQESTGTVLTKEVHPNAFSKCRCMLLQLLPYNQHFKRECLLVACLHAVMLLSWVKTCVKHAAQEMKILLYSYQTNYRNETCSNTCTRTKYKHS